MFKIILNVWKHKKYINVKGDMQGNRLCVRWMTSLFRCDQLATCWCAASRFPIHGASRELTQASAAWTVQGGKKVSQLISFFLKGLCVFRYRGKSEKLRSLSLTSKQLTAPLVFQASGNPPVCPSKHLLLQLLPTPEIPFLIEEHQRFLFYHHHPFCICVSPSVFCYQLCHNHVLASAVSASCFSISI